MVSPEKDTSKALLGSLVLLLISSLIGLCFIEVGFRAYKQFGWQKSTKYFTHKLYNLLPDNPIEYGLYPGVTRENKIPKTGETWSYQINSEGYRGEDFSPAVGSKRVLFLGDSYTFGWAVEQHEVLPEKVERILADPPYNLDIEPYNLGVPGYNTHHEYQLLRQVIDRYAPDLVVLGYVMNDYEPQQNVPERPGIRYQFSTSWAFTFIKELINTMIYDGEPVLDTGYILGYDYLAVIQERGPKWAVARAAYADMVALCKEHNIPFLTLVYPDHTQSFTNDYPFHALHQEVMNWAQEDAARSVDLFEVFRDKDNRNYMVSGDGHPNGKSFTEIAEYIAPLLYESLNGSPLFDPQ